MKFYKVQAMVNGQEKFAFINLDGLQSIHVEAEPNKTFSIAFIFTNTKVKGIKIGGYISRVVAYNDLDRIGKGIQKELTK